MKNKVSSGAWGGSTHSDTWHMPFNVPVRLPEVERVRVKDGARGGGENTSEAEVQ